MIDVAIIGTGPSGIACAITLARSNPELSIALFDKSKFPREKICGDGLSFDTISQLKKLFPDFVNKLINLESITHSQGIRLYSPAGKILEIPFNAKQQNNGGILIKRPVFDELFLEETRQYSNITHHENIQIKNVIYDEDNITLNSDNTIYPSKFAVGAFGYGTLFNKFLAEKPELKRNTFAIRTYFQDVEKVSENLNIELFYLKDILPGYFWIFPMDDNAFNVGLGMLVSDINQRGRNIKDIFNEIINNHPQISSRFRNAKQLESLKGGMIPICTSKTSISGNKFVLTGDAANLADPISGEGIGNAIRSGRIAAEHITKAFANNNFSAKFNLSYDQTIYKKMWREFQTNYFIQKLTRSEANVNRIINFTHNRFIRFLVIQSLQNTTFKEVISRFVK